MIQATKRIIALEQHQAHLDQNNSNLIEVMEWMTKRIEKLEDELEVALGKAPKQMTPEQIARSMDSTRWCPNNPTPVDDLGRLRARVSATTDNG